MINERNFLEQPIKNDMKIYDNIRKILAGQGDDYTTWLFIKLSLFQIIL